MFLVRLEQHKASKMFEDFNQAMKYFVELVYQYDTIPELVYVR